MSKREREMEKELDNLDRGEEGCGDGGWGSGWVGLLVCGGAGVACV